MSTNVEPDMLRGRPFGGEGFAILFKNSISKVARSFHRSDRYAIVKVTALFVNIY